MNGAHTRVSASFYPAPVAWAVLLFSCSRIQHKTSSLQRARLRMLCTITWLSEHDPSSQGKVVLYIVSTGTKISLTCIAASDPRS